MALNPADIKAEMPPLRWRLIEAPCDSASIQGQIVQASRPYPYLDVDAHEGVRRASEIIEANLLFYNTLIDWPDDVYPNLFRRFYEAVTDKSIGPLVHPARGFLYARVLSYDITYDAKDRAGCTMRVRWAETRQDASTSPARIDVPPDAKEFCRDADAGIAAVRVLYPTTADAPVGTDPAIVAKGDAFAASYDQAFASVRLNYPTGEEPTTILGLYESTLGEVQSQFIQLSGWWNRAAGVVAQVADAVELIQDPSLWPATLALRESWRAMHELATEYGEKDRSIGKYTARREMPLDEIAADVGAEIDDLVALNPSAASNPWVQPGQVIRYYVS